MKKTFIAVMAISLLAVSCSKNSMVETNQNVVSQICFDNLTTKAEVTAASQIEAFGVFAEQNGTSQGDVFVSLLENERVYRDENSDFKYDSTRYWMNNSTFRFFAYYPYLSGSNATGITAITPTPNATEFPDFNISFVTPETADADMLVDSKVISIADEPTYPTVDFKFSHAVSKVKLQIAKHGKNSENLIKITSIVFGGIAKSGTYNTLTEEWSDHADKLSLSSFSAETPLVLDANNITFQNVISGMFIPQDINLNSKTIFIEIAYDFYTQDENNEWVKDDESYTATSYLPVGKWEPSQSYVYKLTLSAVDNTISFKSPEVASWGSPNPSGTLIIQ